MRDEWRNDPQYASWPTCDPARFAELLAHAQNTTMCIKHIFEFLASGLDLGLFEMVESRGLHHFEQLKMLPKCLKTKANEV